jgi:chromosome segregation ATPase
MSDIDRLEDKSLAHPQRSLALLPDPSPALPPASYAIDQDELQRLHTELARLQNENHRLHTALLASNERCALLQENADRLGASLTAELKERHLAEEKLQTLIQTITREKEDLEILVQILIDQGDDSAQEGEKARIDGLTRSPTGAVSTITCFRNGAVTFVCSSRFPS